MDKADKASPRIVADDDVILAERTGYALLKCGGCETFLLINSKDFGYEYGFMCSMCKPS